MLSDKERRGRIATTALERSIRASQQERKTEIYCGGFSEMSAEMRGREGKQRILWQTLTINDTALHDTYPRLFSLDSTTH